MISHVVEFAPELATLLPATHDLLRQGHLVLHPRVAGGMRCFEVARYDPLICPNADGFGLYKTQRGFNGFVPADILDVRMMYPCLTIWRN